jgi:hypothetical protein
MHSIDVIVSGLVFTVFRLIVGFIQRASLPRKNFLCELFYYSFGGKKWGRVRVLAALFELL